MENKINYRTQEFMWKTFIPKKKITVIKYDNRKINYVKNYYKHSSIFPHIQSPNNTQSLNRSTVSLTLKIIYLEIIWLLCHVVQTSDHNFFIYNDYF